MADQDGAHASQSPPASTPAPALSADPDPDPALTSARVLPQEQEVEHVGGPSASSPPPPEREDITADATVTSNATNTMITHDPSTTAATTATIRHEDVDLPKQPQTHVRDETMGVASETDTDSLRPLQLVDSYIEAPLDGSSGNFSRIDDELVTKHLQDVESSFLPPISPIQTHNPDGIDDTYLFDKPTAARKEVQDAAEADMSNMLHRSGATLLSPLVESIDPQEVDLDVPLPPSHLGLATPPTAKKQSTPMLPSGRSASSDPSLSSTVAAHGRTMTRALSRVNSRNSLSTGAGCQEQESLGLPPSTDNLADYSADVANLGLQGSQRPVLGSSDSNSLRFGNRPKYLKSRSASQRSSASSVQQTGAGDSDTTLGPGADYALQTGGAVPTLGMSRSMSDMLSRSSSTGSMASKLDEFEDSSRTPRPGDGREISIPVRMHDDPQVMLETPKPTNSLTAPTDTIIARHVRDVQVPESLAREYKTQQGLKTPKPGRKSELETFGTERKSRHMTLKEQSSTLDRLSKENFDLKLKVVFMNQKLGQLSEEGIKDMVKENVELKTALAIAQRDNKSLRRRAKQLEKKLKEADERSATAKSVGSDEDSEEGEREEEMVYLRERIKEYTSEIEHLKNENLAKEVEKRRLADSLKTMADKPGNIGQQEETDMWKDLLEQEIARREQVDDENRKLRDELFRLKHEGPGGLHHTTNIYNINKKNPRTASPARPTSSSHSERENGTVSSSTLADEVQRDRDRLSHEVAELRREINAQASMLTSRNREKDRLYQEIEDLKLAQRRGGPAPSTVDTILERSASRNGQNRSPSRISGASNAMQDSERDEFEDRQAEMRDKVNQLKLQNQNLQNELNSCMNDFEMVLEEKRQLENHCGGLQTELEAAENDLLILQKERDDALQEQEAIGVEFDKLRQEAQDEIDSLEEQEDQLREQIKIMDAELTGKTDDLSTLQHKMREMSEAISQIDDKMDDTTRQNDKLQRELAETNQEVETLEAKLRDANDKTQRLNVQQENYHVEIGFLREEQENHIVKIGNLEASLDAAQQGLHDEKERTKELENRLQSERNQRELFANREKEEVQQHVNELNREASNAKDESRKLRRLLTSKEVETTEWKERLHELENNLRVALGDLSGTRSSLLKVSGWE